MSLKSWNLASCPYKSLVDGTSNFWTLSTGGGTAEYWLNYVSSGITIKPNVVIINGVEADEETAGSLAAGRWAWGNVDTLGQSTLYVRLSDDTDPDTKTAGYVKCSEPLQLLQGTDGKECILLSLLISNRSWSKDAEIRVYHYTSANVLRFAWLFTLLSTDSPFALDSKIVLNNMDKIKIMSSIEDVAALASGDES